MMMLLHRLWCWIYGRCPAPPDEYERARQRSENVRAYIHAVRTETRAISRPERGNRD